MDYKQLAIELVEYLIKKEQQGRMISNRLSEVAKGENAVLLYLTKEKDGANALEISQRFDVNTSRVAAILNSLCKKQFVKRIEDENDKRKIKVYITDLGRDYCFQKEQEVLAGLTMLLERLGENDAKEYIRIMKKISVIVEELEEE